MYLLLCKRYSFSKYERKLVNEPKWEYFKQYNTQEAALDAMKCWQQRGYDEYPGPDRESFYPDFLPLIIIRRFKLVEP